MRMADKTAGVFDFESAEMGLMIARNLDVEDWVCWLEWLANRRMPESLVCCVPYHAEASALAPNGAGALAVFCLRSSMQALCQQ